jgi:hypothetical protein
MSVIPRQSDCLKQFGSPYSAGWGEKHIVRVKCPWQLYMGPLQIPYIKINMIASASLTNVLNDVWDWAGKDPGKIASIHADQFSGDWVIRQARGLKMISMHAYGLAIDFDAPHNGLGSKKHFFKPDNPLIKSFRDAGWTWGGTWSRPDAMHVQYAKVS